MRFKVEVKSCNRKLSIRNPHACIDQADRPPRPALTSRESNATIDHTSMLRTIELRWGLDPPTERDKAAPDLGDVLTLATARTDDPLQGVQIPASDVAHPEQSAPSLLGSIHAHKVSLLPLRNDQEATTVTRRPRRKAPAKTQRHQGTQEGYAESEAKLTGRRRASTPRVKSARRPFPGRSGGRACGLPASGPRAIETTAASRPISAAGLRRRRDRSALRSRSDRPGALSEILRATARNALSTAGQ